MDVRELRAIDGSGSRSTLDERSRTPRARTLAMVTLRVAAAALAMTMVACASQSSPATSELGIADRAPSRTYLGQSARTLADVVDNTRHQFRIEGNELVADGSSMRVTADDGVTVAFGEAEVTIGRAVVHGPAEAAATGCVATYRVLDDGALACEGTYGEEHVRVRDGGIEQGWIIRSASSAPLLIDVPIRGARVVGRGTAGVSLESQGVPFHYSDARVVDARGAEIALRARPMPTGVRFEISQQELTRLAFPLVVDPTFGPEIPLDTPVDYASGRAPGSYGLATDGTTFFAVWTEQPSSTSSPEIWGARFATDGAPLDDLGRQLTSTPTEQEASVAIAYQGGTFYVAYARTSPRAVLLRRFTPSGTAIDATPFVIDTGTDAVSQLRLTSDGSHLVATWLSRPAGAGIESIRGRAIASDGSPLGAGTTTLVMRTSNSVSLDAPRVAAASGNGFLLVWQEQAGYSLPLRILAQRLDLDGALVGGNITVEASASAPPGTAGSTSLVPGHDVVWDGAQYVVASVRGGLVGLSRVATDGALLDSLPVAVSDLGSSLPTLAATSGAVVVSCTTFVGAEYTLRAIRAATASAIVPAPSVVWAREPGAEARLAVASDVVLAVFPGNPAVLQGARLSGSTVLDTPAFYVQRGYDWQFDPSAAWAGSSYIVAWRDIRGSGMGVYALALGEDGAPRLPLATHIASPAGTQPHPHVIGLADGAAILWTDYTPAQVTFSQRVDAMAALVGARVDVPNVDSHFASDGTTIAGVREAGYFVEATIFDLDFEAIAGPFMLGRGDGVTSVAGNAGQYLAVWQGGLVPSAVSGARFDGDARLLDAAPLALSTGFAPDDRPEVVATRDDFLVAWTTRTALVSARVGRDGRLDAPRVAYMPAVTIANGSGHGVCFDGIDYLVVTETSRESLGATWISGSSGIAPAPTPIATLVAAGDTLQPLGTCAGNGSSSALALYTTYDVALHSFRARARSYVRAGGLGHVCATGSECDSGQCVDGVCCDSACGGTDTADCQACATVAGATTDGRCAVLTPSHVCRSSVGACDAAEVCNGTSTSCPGDGPLPDGTSCADAITCNGGEVCAAGDCVEGSPLVCDDGDVCTVDACSEPVGCTTTAPPGCCHLAADCDDGHACTAETCAADGSCHHDPIADCCESDVACDDGSPCTVDTCSANACEHSTDAACCTSALDCDDGSACTVDACEANRCVHSGACDASTPDAAQPDAGRDAGPGDAGPPPPPPAACACRAGSPWNGSGGPLVVAFALAFVVGRRRRPGVSAR